MLLLAATRGSMVPSHHATVAGVAKPAGGLGWGLIPSRQHLSSRRLAYWMGWCGQAWCWAWRQQIHGWPGP